jgi:uncharacterized protein YgbK (DUF1537 family)
MTEPTLVDEAVPVAERTVDEGTLLAAFPPSRSVDPTQLADLARVPGKFLIVIDDDPTGSQSVANVPLLTSWAEADLRWAMDQGSPVVFVLTNSRSVDAETAATRNDEVVTNATAVARAAGYRLTFLSRSDSILRGHFPQETDAVELAMTRAGADAIDGVVLVPAFPSAGRITVAGVHYLRDGDQLVPVAQTQFARDASFGFHHSDLREYVEEKTGGRVSSSEVVLIDLAMIRSTPDAIADHLAAVSGGRVVVADCVTDDDLRALCVGLALAEQRGKVFLYRTGPAFIGARIGQPQPKPLETNAIATGSEDRQPGGLVVIGSHVDLTNRQLASLCAGRPDIIDIELQVELLAPEGAAAEAAQACAEYLGGIVDAVSQAIRHGDVILRTSRALKIGSDSSASLSIARVVSAAVSGIVHGVATTVRPRFVVAKGGITSNDVASAGLEIGRGIIQGPLLPGLVSLWHPAEGLAAGIPYVVFPGNVGDDDALLTVVNKLSLHRPVLHD